jgi:hypothetical protein
MCNVVTIFRSNIQWIVHLGMSVTSMSYDKTNNCKPRHLGYLPEIF